MGRALMTALVTGYPTSFLATRVVRKLLQESQRDVWCVVQAKSMARAEALREQLDADEKKRLHYLEGDSASLDLGLSGREFMMLCREIELIHHCAAATYLGVSRKVAECTNIGGAREILELAESASGLHRLVFWSSALVCGNRNGEVLEGEYGRTFRNVGEETRMRAERLVVGAIDHVPMTILRPAHIVGDSRTGEIDRLEGPYLLLQLLRSAPPELRVPMPGRGNRPLNMVPIDYVVDAGFAIAHHDHSIGKTFHIVDPQPLTARRVFELFAERLGRPVPRGSVPTAFATLLMRTPGLQRFANVPRTFLEQLSTDVAFDDRNARPILSEAGLSCPRFEDYVDAMIDIAEQHSVTRDDFHFDANDV